MQEKVKIVDFISECENYLATPDRLIVCRITGKNGAEFKNHVEN